MQGARSLGSATKPGVEEPKGEVDAKQQRVWDEQEAPECTVLTPEGVDAR